MWTKCCLFLCMVACIFASAERSKRGVISDLNSKPNANQTEVSIHVAQWNWDHVGIYVTITIFIVLSGLAKVAFHHAHFLSSRIPESCLLVVVGLIMGAIIYVAAVPDCESNPCEVEKNGFDFPEFSPPLFFYFLLPPIILEASYSLYDKAFFDNLSTILVMAVIGTAFNFLLIGALLYGVFHIGAMGKIRGPFSQYKPGIDTSILITDSYDLSIVEILLFSSLISAVDPVAVLAIFQEVGVNPDLYFLVFGESLLNDGVAVVFYNMMKTFAEMAHEKQPITVLQCVLGLLSFGSVALGGLTIGIIMGFLTALITKTTADVTVMEPLALFGMAYLSYMTAELFHWSGIISLIGCGLIQAHYSFKNISKKSFTTVKYFIKMASSTSDITIFLFLGIGIIKGPHYWHTGFTVWTLSFCLICRFLGVYGLTWLANRRRVKKINLQEQFIMAYGGLRGAVGFSLVNMISAAIVPPKEMFVTTTLAVVMFTIFFQGGTIKFLVNLLDIDKKKEDEQQLISEEVNDTVIEHVMVGIDVISGKRGKHYLGRLLEHYDEKYLMKWFCRCNKENDLTRLFEKLALSDHLVNLYGPTLLHERGKGDVLLHPVDSDEGLGFTTEESSSSGTLSRSSSGRRVKKPESAPPLPPRSSRRSFFGGFNPKSGSDASTLHMLSSPGHDEEVGLRRKLSRTERDVVRHVLKSNSMTKRLDPNDVADDDKDHTYYAQLRQRHAQARRISEMMLHCQPETGQMKTSAGKLQSEQHGRPRHINVVGQEQVQPFNATNGPPETIEMTYLSHIPQRHRPGVEAVLHGHQHRVRSMSMSSDPDNPYDNNSTSMQKQQCPTTTTAFAHNMAEAATKATASTSTSSTASLTPVGKKRAVNNAAASGGRRKLTPHPLAPTDARQLSTSDVQADAKLSILEEDEEKSKGGGSGET